MSAEALSAQQGWEQHISETLITGDAIAKRLEAMADTMAEKYRSLDRPLVVIPILKGGVFPGVELVKLLGQRGVASRIDFLWFESYCGTESTGDVRKLADLQSSIQGETVLLVDDLIDTGLTLAEAHRLVLSRSPRLVEICVLLEKLDVPRNPLAKDITPEYIGFQIPRKFVIGAFMDFNEHFRSLNDVVIFKKRDHSNLGAIDSCPVRKKKRSSSRSRSQSPTSAGTRAPKESPSDGSNSASA